jgi:bacterioferritin-associated ferredoxin
MEMYVCVCLAISQSEVEEAIHTGATTVGEVTRTCKAGGDCGACHGMIEQMIDDHLESVGVPSLRSRVAAPCVAAAAGSSEQLIDPSALVRTRAA